MTEITYQLKTECITNSEILRYMEKYCPEFDQSALGLDVQKLYTEHNKSLSATDCSTHDKSEHSLMQSASLFFRMDLISLHPIPLHPITPKLIFSFADTFFRSFAIDSKGKLAPKIPPKE